MVRNVLIKAQKTWCDWGAHPRLCADAEQVLAEVLNNVVKHAYAGRSDGAVVLDHRLATGGLHFDVQDNGQPMPNGAIPMVDSVEIGEELEGLPEGGFGWFLIQQMTKELRYRRSGDCNILQFCVPAQE
ncbi:Serine-protein kinase RsbW [Candidatus Rhodobacter oscarellae]|uniref:Serine-protein kinase RsbW n=1 Tax=Candidatus Rhodobacter oscarellae TaxID=1675527 RepID=A0A0J9GYM0_9RHOB|nr:Serine-protein kinase RsbW [Candidatus Rhodobacter lobularis]